MNSSGNFTFFKLIFLLSIVLPIVSPIELPIVLLIVLPIAPISRSPVCVQRALHTSSIPIGPSL